MVWTIIIVLIIIVVLKGVFNTTIRDNPKSGYKEVYNNLKNIIVIQKERGLYVTYSEIDGCAHGIYFIDDMAGHIKGEADKNKSASILMADLVRLVKTKRLQAVTFRSLGLCQMVYYSNSENNIWARLKDEPSPNDLTYYYIEGIVESNTSIKGSIKKEIIHSLYDEIPGEKYLVRDQVFNYQEF